MKEELSIEVKKILYEHVETLEQLEVLVLLCRRPEQLWTVDMIESKLSIPGSDVYGAVKSLLASGAVSRMSGIEGEAYEITREPKLRSMIGKLVESYESNRFSVIKLVSEAAMDRVRSSMTRAFADAFVLGGKKNPRG